MISFTGMSENTAIFNKIKTVLKKIEYYATQPGGRGKVCYHWSTGEVTCPIKVSSVAIYGSSPLNDIVHLNSQHNMLVVNDEGQNTYKFTIKSTNRKLVFQIVDKVRSPSAIFRIQSDEDKDIKVVYREKDQSYEIYQQTEFAQRNDAFTLKTIVKYKGSKNIPAVYVKGQRVRITNMPRTIAQEQTRSTARLYDSASYNFQANAKGQNDQPKSVCVCKPQNSYPEGYWTIVLTSQVDTLIIANTFIDTNPKLSIKLLYDKIFPTGGGSYKYGWLLQVREKLDLSNSGEKRADLRLKNVEVVSTQDGRVLADLTDDHSLRNEVDINVAAETTYLYNQIGNKDHDLDDTVIFKGGLNNGDLSGNVDFGAGTNSLVYDTTASLSLQYQIVGIAVDASSSDSEDIQTRQVKIYGGSNHATFDNVDRVVCQFTGGLQRELPQFASGGTTSSRSSLQTDCDAVDPYRSGAEFEGKTNLPKEDTYCDAYCRA